jgi:hypothetical protein
MAADVAGEAAPLLLPSTRDGERIRKQRHSAPRTTLKQGSGEPGRGESEQGDFGSAPSTRAPENTVGDAGREAMGMGRGNTYGINLRD